MRGAQWSAEGSGVTVSPRERSLESNGTDEAGNTKSSSEPRIVLPAEAIEKDLCPRSQVPVITRDSVQVVIASSHWDRDKKAVFSKPADHAHIAHPRKIIRIGPTVLKWLRRACSNQKQRPLPLNQGRQKQTKQEGRSGKDSCPASPEEFGAWRVRGPNDLHRAPLKLLSPIKKRLTTIHVRAKNKIRCFCNLQARYRAKPATPQSCA